MAARHHPEGGFATTRWSTVAVAVNGNAQGARAALERLCEDYWRALFAFALRQGRDVHTAEDLTQAFFAHFLARGYLRAADRSRGRFRTFLLTCFQHFLAHEWEKRRAIKRGGRLKFLSYEDHRQALESRAAERPELGPARHYDREWALTIMERAWFRLEAEVSGDGRADQFRELSRFLQVEAGPGEYAAVAARLAWTDRAVKLGVHRLRRRYGRLVRDEVRETVADEGDVADELRYLVELMAE